MSPPTLPQLPEGLTFASALIKAREGKGLTQRQLSEACGVSLSAIKAYESGRNLPGARELREICQAVHVSPNMMLFGVESPFSAQSTIEALLNVSDIPESEHALPSRLGMLATLLAPEERDSLLTLATSLAISRHGEEVVRNAVRSTDAITAAARAMMHSTGEAIKSGTEIDAAKVVAKFESAMQDLGHEPKKTRKK